MTCRECAELLMDFLEGELDAQSQANFQQHLKDCPPCIAYVESYQITIQWSRQLTCIQLPPEAAARIQAAVEAKLKEQS
jgi:anti-sigma factor RsiW